MTKDSPFPITEDLRRQLDPHGTIFDSEGGLAVAGIRGARLLALELNRHEGGALTARAGAVHALGLLHRVLREVLRSHRDEESDPLPALLRWLRERLGESSLDAALLAVADTYPPAEVLNGETSASDYLVGVTDGIPHRLLLLEELLLIWWINRNPALETLRPLFDDSPLRETVYSEITSRLREFFADREPIREEGMLLLDVLEEPLVAAPESLRRQVEILAKRAVAPESPHPELARELLVASDLLREEEKASFVGPGPVETPVFADLEGTPRRLAEDSPWMAGVVLGAKHVHVWLHQLETEYGSTINRLDEIPRAALEHLVELGCNALWLIGIWERSPASRRIKRLCGNPEAEASAYSLLEYRVANDLGGDDALKTLEALATEVGLRLATDMVPNHTGIDSRWIMEKPEYFLALDESPFPSYTFDGPDLSDDPKAAIHLEDHYYDRTDAAVVFRRTDRETETASFIYHGNDGTGLPWSDTAQLNYLNPEVREAVIDEIISVARRFPVVRFDAAMTLTLQHFHRLWYPAPGTGGDIPSRAEYGVDDDVFRAMMPEEFWWEVAQRLREEAPDTLLVAEAFWLLEGYFVRSLGIHRVYNSAFMHMLREENGSSLRRLLRGALVFDPVILARFVNFLSNPDEETARQQFGSGAKYFAAASLLATLPGTPMFAHGQIGGLSEKYGMEYRRPYRRETDDPRLVERHMHQILPLLRMRSAFSGSHDFELFDFLDGDDAVNESVIAFTNRTDELSVLVVCNYSDRSSSGRLGSAAPRKVDGVPASVTSLHAALGLGKGDDHLIEILDPREPDPIGVDPSDLIESGLVLELGPFQVMVATLRTLESGVSSKSPRLAATLAQRTVLASRNTEPALDPLQQSFRDLLLMDQDSERLHDASIECVELAWDKGAFGAVLAGELELAQKAANLERAFRGNRDRALDPAVRLLLVSYDLIVGLSRPLAGEGPTDQSARSHLELLNLGPALASAARSLRCSTALAQDLVGCLRALLAADDLAPRDALFEPQWLHDSDVRDLLRVHTHDGQTFFRREGLERMLWARFLLLAAQGEAASIALLADLLLVEEYARLAGYRLDGFLQGLLDSELDR